MYNFLLFQKLLLFFFYYILNTCIQYRTLKFHTSGINLFSSVFQLAQHYLILAEEKDTELNNRLAVNWLINAAKQGRKGAARLLQRCWIQKKG